MGNRVNTRKYARRSRQGLPGAGRCRPGGRRRRLPGPADAAASAAARKARLRRFDASWPERMTRDHEMDRLVGQMGGGRGAGRRLVRFDDVLVGAILPGRPSGEMEPRQRGGAAAGCRRTVLRVSAERRPQAGGRPMDIPRSGERGRRRGRQAAGRRPAVGARPEGGRAGDAGRKTGGSARHGVRRERGCGQRRLRPHGWRHPRRHGSRWRRLDRPDGRRFGRRLGRTDG